MRCDAPLWARWLLSAGLFVLLFMVGSRPAAARPPPSFEHEAELASNNGAALLSWADNDNDDDSDDSDAREYELQEAGAPSFVDATTCYRGSFPSFFVSGRRDGTRYFRVRSRPAASPASAWSSWSEAQILVVQHHDLGLALGLFGAGAVVFVATCLTLIVGARSRESNRGSRGDPR